MLDGTTAELILDHHGDPSAQGWREAPASLTKCFTTLPPSLPAPPSSPPRGQAWVTGYQSPIKANWWPCDDAGRRRNHWSSLSRSPRCLSGLCGLPDTCL
ncbi:hypothetical protein O3P69_013171 [Scylla paramamosain]|uniref:Uncharacterized protein n=1 Tax=Scylla paramamosain TaxID=85552 RepID=A0AAW0U3K4_SCYPA